MKDLVLDPEDCRHSHGLSDTWTLRRLELAILEDRWDKVPPVYVVQPETLPGKYIIYNGNRRLHIATLFSKPLKTKLIESDEDLENIPVGEGTSWDVCNWYERPDGVPQYSPRYEHIVMKLCDWALHCPEIPSYERKGIDWDTPNKSRLEKLIDRETPSV